MLTFSRALAVTVVLLAQSAFCAQSIHDEAAHYSLQLPDAWEEMSPESLKAINAFVTARMPDKSIQYSRGFKLKGAFAGTYPYILVQNVPMDIGNASYEQIERSLSRSMGAEVKSAENAFSDVGKNVSVGVPVLDRSKNWVLMRINMDVAGAGQIQGFSVGHLSSKSNIFVHSYALNSEFQKYLPVFNQINESFQFDAGHEFTPGSGGIFGKIPKGVVIGALAGAFIVGVFVVLAVLIKILSKKRDA
jgi:hypothetical protein